MVACILLFCLCNFLLVFKTVFRPAALLVFGMKINPAIGTGLGHHFGFQFEVLKWLGIARVKQMATLSAGNERAVLNLPGAAVLGGGFPAVERLAVKNRDEAGLAFSGEG